ncbi:MAG: hypothetical protein QG622_2883 [Actinomycetota bacterium]|nr:hypothetical protein [Actinomycetota bacterium]
MTDQDWMELSEAITQLRSQLSAAREAAVGQDLLFTVGAVEVELGVEARREAGGGGGLKFGVVSLQGKGSLSSGTTHKVKLQLQPHDRAGGSIDVGDTVSALPSR